MICLAPQAQEEIVRLRRQSGSAGRPLNFTVRGTVRGRCRTQRRHVSPCCEDPFVSAAVGATASAPELHCLMNRPGISAQSPPRTLALRRCVGGSILPRRFRLSLRFVRHRSCAPARGEAVPSDLGGFVWRQWQSL